MRFRRPVPAGRAPQDVCKSILGDLRGSLRFNVLERRHEADGWLPAKEWQELKSLRLEVGRRKVAKKRAEKVAETEDYWLAILRDGEKVGVE